jgi:alkaline phosphatase
MGKASGVVTTVEWSHATPAGMFAHNTSRNNYSQIANEMLGSTSPLSVIMGAGNPGFDDNGKPASKSANYVGGDTTWSALKNGSLNGWTLIQDKSQFENLANGGLVLDKVVGTFQTYTTAQQARGDASVKGVDLNNASGVAFNNNVPSLATMSTGALNVLKQDKDGFFLMVEGGAVDWANLANQLDRMIEEQIDFNKSVKAVVNWVNANSSWKDTLLIVTADHETGFLWGEKAGFPTNFDPLKDNGAGKLPGARYFSTEHTNSLVPLYAIGAGSELFDGYADATDPVRGKYIDNTEIFLVMNSQITAAPIPGSFLLLGSGIMGMILIGRRRKCA